MKRTEKYAAEFTALTLALLCWLVVNYGEAGVIAIVVAILWACIAAILFLAFKVVIEYFWEGD